MSRINFPRKVINVIIGILIALAFIVVLFFSAFAFWAEVLKGSTFAVEWANFVEIFRKTQQVEEALCLIPTATLSLFL